MRCASASICCGGSVDRMSGRGAILTVYAGGVVQGLALVTFPAAGAVLTSPTGFGLSSSQYGAMFVPQAVMAVLASLLGAGLRRRIGSKRLLLLGLAANGLAMALLVASRFWMQQPPTAYAILLVATTCMGAGFGLTVPALNTLAAALAPGQVDRAVLRLNALLGLGTAVAPVLVALFAGAGIWWGLPLTTAVFIAGLAAYAGAQALPDAAPTAAATAGRTALPARFWLYAAFALLYGICETLNGNWATLYMRAHFSASAALSSFVLTLFWSMVTFGRLAFAALERWLPARAVCRWSPVVLALALFAIAALPAGDAWAGLAAFGAAGLGCAALLPLAISFSQTEFQALAGSMAGMLIAVYQVGYGIAAFGAGRLQAAAALPLGQIYGGAAMIALVLCGLAFGITRDRALPGRTLQTAN
jgi:MFS family permease